MFGVCGIISAQNASNNDLKLKQQKPTTTTTNTVAAVPQKSAVATPAPTAASMATTDVEAARTPQKVYDAKPEVTGVNAAGVSVTTPDAAKQKQAAKAAAVKANNEKKPNGN